MSRNIFRDQREETRRCAPEPQSGEKAIQYQRAVAVRVRDRKGEHRSRTVATINKRFRPNRSANGPNVIAPSMAPSVPAAKTSPNALIGKLSKPAIVEAAIAIDVVSAPSSIATRLHSKTTAIWNRLKPRSSTSLVTSNGLRRSRSGYLGSSRRGFSRHQPVVGVRPSVPGLPNTDSRQPLCQYKLHVCTVFLRAHAL